MTNRDDDGEAYSIMTTLQAMLIGGLSFILAIVVDYLYAPGTGAIAFLGIFVVTSILVTFRRNLDQTIVQIISSITFLIHALLIACLPPVDGGYLRGLVLPVGILEYSILFVIINGNLKGKLSD